jgi:hypothetical protein
MDLEDLTRKMKSGKILPQEEIENYHALKVLGKLSSINK